MLFLVAPAPKAEQLFETLSFQRTSSQLCCRGSIGERAPCQYSDRVVYKVAQRIKGNAVDLVLKAPLGLRNFDAVGCMSRLL